MLASRPRYSKVNIVKRPGEIGWHKGSTYATRHPMQLLTPPENEELGE